MGNAKAKIYLLPGLCFDKRIFENLTLNSNQINFINWIEPDENETLTNYVRRISEQIPIDGSEIILIGHSFGGIVIQEISKIIQVKKVIIISSIKLESEKPNSLKFFKLFPLYKIINKSLVLKTFPIWARVFGYNSEKGRTLFTNMLSNCTDNYFKWAFNKVVNWKNDAIIHENLYHIHGTNDKTFPIKLISNPIIVQDGSHFMVNSKAEEVSKILNVIL